MVITNATLKKQQRGYKMGKHCEYCGERYPPFCMTVDHIIPRAFYGDAYDKSNWQVLCSKCHEIKTNAETLILSGQANTVSPLLYKNMKGLAEFRDKANEVREKLNISNNNRVPLNHYQFEAVGVKFKK